MTEEQTIMTEDLWALIESDIIHVVESNDETEWQYLRKLLEQLPTQVLNDYIDTPRF
jgi:hypothetical protein